MVYRDTLSVVSIAIFIFTVVVNLWHIKVHLSHWREPVMQTLYVRVIFMPVVYAFCAMMGLLFGINSVLFDVLRDGYEAYGIFCFITMIFVFTRGERAVEAYMDANPATLRQFGVLCRCMCGDYRSGHSFVRFIRVAILQFVLFKPLLALFNALVEIRTYDLEHPYDKSHAGTIALLGRAQNLITALIAIVVITALYALFNCYSATKGLLVGLSPLTKFLSIKAIVAFTIVQRIVCTILLRLHVINGISATAIDAETESIRIQDILISLEMVIFTVVFYFSFSYSEFRMKASSPSTLSTGAKIAACLKLWDIFTRVDNRKDVHELQALSGQQSGGGSDGDASAPSAPPSDTV